MTVGMVTVRIDHLLRIWGWIDWAFVERRALLRP